MEINILKCHGTGNDFILIDEYKSNYNFNEEERRKIAILGCNRKNFIGADGILFVQKSEKSDARMRIFNSDGSEAEMCGNGLRCVGRYVMELLGKNKVEIETMKAKYEVVKVDDIYPGVKTVKIFIDSVSLDPKSLPMITDKEKVFIGEVPELSDKFKFTAVSITNPHLVSIVDKVSENDLVQIGSRGNNVKELLPKGVNLSFVKIFDRNNIYVKTYERGVGLTKSCGTAMTASSIVAALSDGTNFEEEVNVFNDGGAIKTVVHKKPGESYLVDFIGNATFVFNGTMDFSMDEVKNAVIDETPYENETDDYTKFFEFTRKNIKL